MKNWIIILLALLVVIAGAFLPELLLGADSLPELDLDYGQVSVTSQSSSGYTWRMEQIGEKYFGEGEHLLSTYISEEGPEQQSQEGYAQFREELGQLMDLGVIPQNIETLLEEKRDYHIRYYYLFDNESVSGFRIAEFTASAANWRISACMDVESGKLAKVEYGGSRLIPGEPSTPRAAGTMCSGATPNTWGWILPPTPPRRQLPPPSSRRGIITTASPWTNGPPPWSPETPPGWSCGCCGRTTWPPLRCTTVENDSIWIQKRINSDTQPW